MPRQYNPLAEQIAYAMMMQANRPAYNYGMGLQNIGLALGGALSARRQRKLGQAARESFFGDLAEKSGYNATPEYFDDTSMFNAIPTDMAGNMAGGGLQQTGYANADPGMAGEMAGGDIPTQPPPPVGGAPPQGFGLAQMMAGAMPPSPFMGSGEYGSDAMQREGVALNDPNFMKMTRRGSRRPFGTAPGAGNFTTLGGGPISTLAGTPPELFDTMKKAYLSNVPELQQIAVNWIEKSLNPTTLKPSEYLLRAGEETFYNVMTGQFIRGKMQPYETTELKPGSNYMIFDPYTGNTEAISIPKEDDGKEIHSIGNKFSATDKNGAPMYSPVIIYKDGTTRDLPYFNRVDSSVVINPTELTTATRGEFQQKAMTIRQALMGYDQIAGMYHSEPLTYKGQAMMKLSGFLAKMGALNLFPVQKIKYEQGIEMLAAINQAANEYIKYITGAQMSEKEAERLLNAIPNVKDDQVAFLAKLNYVTRIATMSLNVYEKELSMSGDERLARLAGDAVVQKMFPVGTPDYVIKQRAMKMALDDELYLNESGAVQDPDSNVWELK